MMVNAIGGRGIVVAGDALPEMESLPLRTILVDRGVAGSRIPDRLRDSASAILTVPAVELDRLGQVRLAAVLALTEGLLDIGDTAVFLAGPYRAHIDTLVTLTLGAEYELIDTTEQPRIDAHIRREVFLRVLEVAFDLGRFGREGRRVGALMVVGDHAAVLAHSEQMILNPFKGYSARDRSILSTNVTETVKELSAIDGAFILRGSGVVETAGARLRTPGTAPLPAGLGARHGAAASITAITRAVAVTVSQTDGAVRVWRAGRLVAHFLPAAPPVAPGTPRTDAAPRDHP